MNTELIYSEERGTWNVFVNGEWYYEDANYERAEEFFFNCCRCDEDEWDYEDENYEDENYEDEWDYERNEE